MSAGSLALVAPRLSRTLAWRPESPYWLFVGAAWGLVASRVGGDHRMAPGGIHGHVMDGGMYQHPQTAFTAWMVMVVATMVPLAMPGARHVGRNSFRFRRHRAMATYLLAFIVSWVPAGVVAAGIDRYAPAQLGSWWRAAALAVAATWQLTRPKRRALLACHRTLPLPPLGRAADLAVTRFATFQATRCARSCWALMLVMLAAGHSVLAMAGLTALAVVEETRLPRRELQRWFAVPLGAAAMLSAAVTLGWTSGQPRMATAPGWRAFSWSSPGAVRIAPSLTSLR